MPSFVCVCSFFQWSVLVWLNKVGMYNVLRHVTRTSLQASISWTGHTLTHISFLNTSILKTWCNLINVEHFCLYLPFYLSIDVTGSTFVGCECVCLRAAFHVEADHSHSPGLMEVLEKEVDTFLPLPVVQPSVCSFSSFIPLLVVSFTIIIFLSCFILFTTHRAWTRLPWPMPPFWMVVGVGPTVPWLAQWVLWLSVFLLSLLSLTLSTPRRWAYIGIDIRSRIPDKMW